MFRIFNEFEVMMKNSDLPPTEISIARIPQYSRFAEEHCRSNHMHLRPERLPVVVKVIFCLIVMLVITLISKQLTAQISDDNKAIDLGVDPEWVSIYEAGDFIWAYDIAVDAAGNTYSTGYFQRNLKVGEKTWIEPTSKCYSRCPDTYFLMKHDPDGNLLWVRHGNGNSRPARIAFDRQGVIWVVGNDYGSATEFTTTDERLIKLSKDIESATQVFALGYSPDGDLIYAWMVPGSEHFDVNDFCIDPKGNFYLAGSYQFRNYEKHYEVRRSFAVMKFNPNFSLAWQLRGDTIGQSHLQSICTDHKGNVIVTGGFSNRVTFGKSGFTTQGYDGIAFLLKLDSGGDIIWALDSLGSFKIGSGRSVVCDPKGDIYAVTTSPYSTTVLSGITSKGKIKWSHTIKGKGTNYHERLITDGKDRIYLTGEGYGGTFESFRSPSLTYQSSGGTDFYFAAYSTKGDLLWLRSGGGKGTDYCKGISIASGKLYAFGWFGGEMAFRDTVVKGRSGYIFWIGRFDLWQMQQTEALSKKQHLAMQADTLFDWSRCTCHSANLNQATVFFPRLESLVSRHDFYEITGWHLAGMDTSFNTLFFRDLQYATSYNSGFYSLRAIRFRSPIQFMHPRNTYGINFTPCTNNLQRFELPVALSYQKTTEPEYVADFGGDYIGIDINPKLVRGWNVLTNTPLLDSIGMSAPVNILMKVQKMKFTTRLGIQITPLMNNASQAEITGTGILMQPGKIKLIAEADQGDPLINPENYPFFIKSSGSDGKSIDQKQKHPDDYDKNLLEFTGLLIHDATLSIPIRNHLFEATGQDILLNNKFITGIMIIRTKSVIQNTGGPLKVEMQTKNTRFTITLEELAQSFSIMGIPEVHIQLVDKDMMIYFRKNE
jgi:hypothetical protein